MSETKVSLIDKLKGITMSNFQFSSFEKLVTTPDPITRESKEYLVFQLTDPIPTVRGSKKLFDPNSGKKIQVIQNDVVEIRCMFDVIANHEEGFKFDEDKDGNLLGTGSYSGNLTLDISNAEDVWITDEKFSSFAQSQKEKENQSRIEKMVALHQAARK